jgi:hypothetical protein
MDSDLDSIPIASHSSLWYDVSVTVPYCENPNRIILYGVAH